MNKMKTQNMARDVILRYFNDVLAHAFFMGDVSQYRGRLVFEDKQQTVEFIRLIDWLNIEFGLTGHYIAKVIIEEYNIKELEVEE